MQLDTALDRLPTAGLDISAVVGAHCPLRSATSGARQNVRGKINRGPVLLDRHTRPDPRRQRGLRPSGSSVSDR
jgi:hypothetical protein